MPKALQAKVMVADILVKLLDRTTLVVEQPFHRPNVRCIPSHMEHTPSPLVGAASGCGSGSGSGSALYSCKLPFRRPHAPYVHVAGSLKWIHRSTSAPSRKSTTDVWFDDDGGDRELAGNKSAAFPAAATASNRLSLCKVPTTPAKAGKVIHE